MVPLVPKAMAIHAMATRRLLLLHANAHLLLCHVLQALEARLDSLGQ